MSSLTISITEWREAQPSSASVGLSTRTLARPGCARGAELPVRQQRAQQVLGCALGEVLRVQALEVLGGEGFDQLLAGRLQPRGGQREHGIDAVVHRLG